MREAPDDGLSMFIKHFWHKGPRLEARPQSMAAFYDFKAAVSAFL